MPGDTRLILEDAASICQLIESLPDRVAALEAVRELRLPDWWIGAGFVRAAVWDHLHGFIASTPLPDIDVIWFDPACAEEALDRQLETRLGELLPSRPWSVKNQARMHRQNGDAPYQSSADAIGHWPETAGAIGVTLDEGGTLRLLAPLGIRDLLAMIVRPTPHFHRHRMATYDKRMRNKDWQATWPRLRFESLAGESLKKG